MASGTSKTLKTHSGKNSYQPIEGDLNLQKMREISEEGGRGKQEWEINMVIYRASTTG